MGTFPSHNYFPYKTTNAHRSQTNFIRDMGKETSSNKATVVGIEDFQMQIARCNQIIEEVSTN